MATSTPLPTPLHVRIDNVVIDEYLPKICVYGLTIFAVIKRHLNWTTGQCSPSYERIATIIGTIFVPPFILQVDAGAPLVLIGAVRTCVRDRC